MRFRLLLMGIFNYRLVLLIVNLVGWVAWWFDLALLIALLTSKIDPGQLRETTTGW